MEIYFFVKISLILLKLVQTRLKKYIKYKGNIFIVVKDCDKTKHVTGVLVSCLH